MYIYNKKLFLEKEVIKRKLPINIKTNDYWIFKDDLQKKINKVYYYKINNFFLTGNTFNINSRDIIFDFLQISNISKYKFVKKLLLITFFFFNKVTKLPVKTKYINKAIIIHNRHSEGYFHWMSDCILKIVAIQKYKKFIKYPIVLPNQLNNNFHIESLKLLNIKYIRQKKNLKIKEAIYIPDLSPSGSPRPKLVNLLRNYLFNKNTNKNNLEKIYISRKKSRRKILNENQLVSILLKYNFKIYHMEDLKLVQQIKLCNSAKTIIGLHGAGLTNCLWMKKKTNLIEIRPENELNLNCYFFLANILKLKYYYFFCKKKSIFKTVTSSDYILDVESFEKNFANILKL